jgi:hypothetical protein
MLGQCVHTLPSGKDTEAMRISAGTARGTELLAVGYGLGFVKLEKVEDSGSLKNIAELSHADEEEVYSVKFMDSHSLLSAGNDTLYLWDLTTHKTIHTHSFSAKTALPALGGKYCV